MLIEQTFQLLSSMRMPGFARALREQLDNDDYQKLSFEERVGLLVDTEYADRESRKLTRRLQHAKLREKACIEDIDYRGSRGVDKAMIRRLATCKWVNKHQNIILTGPTGVGKTYIACALADQVCREGMSAIYRRMPRLLHELLLARADGTYSKLLARFAKTDVLIVDDWGIAPLADQERRDLLEVFEDRHESSSTVLATQLPVEKWHGYIGEPTIADAILDRLVHNAHRVELKGGSMRKKRANLATESDKPDN
ncbi:MAG: IS21-like element helper ATPase IstB [Polyangiaceae bacterium]